MFELVKQYSGNGAFHFLLDKETILNLNFNLVQYSNANIYFECYLTPTSQEVLQNFVDIFNNFSQRKEIKVTMDGEVELNGKIKVEEAYLTTINIEYDKPNLLFKLGLTSFKPVELVFKEIKSGDIRAYAGLTNFVFKGCETIVNSYDGFKVSLNGFDVFFIQNENYKQKLDSLKKEDNSILVTSELLIHFSKGNLNFTEITTNLTDLLSYSCRNRISPIYEDYYSEDNLLKTVLRPVITKEFNKGYNLINSEHVEECNLKYYLKTCHKNYLEYQNKFALDIVIAFYLETITQNFTDISFLLAATTLETLLNGYEELREEERNPIIKGILKKNKKEILKVLKEFETQNSEEIANKIVDEIAYQHPTVNDKLSALTKDKRFKIKLNTFDRDFIPIRNKIAHTGKFPETINSNGSERTISMQEEFTRLIFLIDRIILAILSYRESPFMKLDGSITVLKEEQT